MSEATGIKYLEITRVFNAPRAQVWKAWTDPELFKKWWGPEGFSAPVVNMDPRPGGQFLGAMEGGPEMRELAGKRMYSTGTYKEVVPMEKLVMSDAFSDEHGNVIDPSEVIPGGQDWPKQSELTVTFEDAGEGKTKLTIKHGPFPTGAMFDNARQGWNSSFNKLAKAVEQV
jgi:uncharacterized protein YndB with AHSA1/START domain